MLNANKQVWVSPQQNFFFSHKLHVTNVCTVYTQVCVSLMEALRLVHAVVVVTCCLLLFSVGYGVAVVTCCLVLDMV